MKIDFDFKIKFPGNLPELNIHRRGTKFTKDTADRPSDSWERFQKREYHLVKFSGYLKMNQMSAAGQNNTLRSGNTCLDCTHMGMNIGDIRFAHYK